MSGGRLSTHVLDVARGCPAAGVAVTLVRLEDGKATVVQATVTNADGRTDVPLLTDPEPGVYELRFAVGAYFGLTEDEAFLWEVPVRFRLVDRTAGYHVPLLVTPWAYQTYRGS